ncbi:hypothetical protein ASG77_04135 [Arthrobacter sp. Soil762]|nr:hypothetical protein ASG77_04135 [Arthrobacter sp. Soil762]
MIIQAGFDLQILVRPLIVQDGRVLPKLVVIGLDADMQLDGIKVVSDEFAGLLVPYHICSSARAPNDRASPPRTLWPPVSWTGIIRTPLTGSWLRKPWWKDSRSLQQMRIFTPLSP